MSFRSSRGALPFRLVQLAACVGIAAAAYRLTHDLWATVWFGFVTRSAVDGLAMILGHRTRRYRRVLFDAIYLLPQVVLSLLLHAVLHAWWMAVILAYSTSTTLAMYINSRMFPDIWDEYGIRPPRDQLMPLSVAVGGWTLTVLVVFAVRHFLLR